jgi:hypothetical protein
MRQLIFVLGLIGYGAVASAQAADGSPHAIGTEVRFRSIGWRDEHTDLGWMNGRLVSMTPDTVRVRICAQCREPYRDLAPVSAFEIQRHVGVGASRGSNMRHGALFGAVAGLFYAGARASSDRRQGEAAGLEALSVPLWSSGGAAIGTLIGAALSPGRWEPVRR